MHWYGFVIINALYELYFLSAPDVSNLLKEDLRKYNFPLHGTLLELGTLEISQDSTLEDLKSQILTLPVVITWQHEYRVICIAT